MPHDLFNLTQVDDVGKGGEEIDLQSMKVLHLKREKKKKPRHRNKSSIRELLNENSEEAIDRWLKSVKSGNRYRPTSRGDYGLASMRPLPGKTGDEPARNIWQRWQNIQEEKKQQLTAAAPSKSDLKKHFNQRHKVNQDVGELLAIEGQRIAQQRRLGHTLFNNSPHVHVRETLEAMERVWKSGRVSEEGLTMEQFVTFMREISSGMSAEELELIYYRLDSNSDGFVSWDEWLDTVLQEVRHSWKATDILARGPGLLPQSSSAFPSNVCSGADFVRDVVVVPPDPASRKGAKYLFRCEDQVQVWRANTFSHLMNLPVPEHDDHRSAIDKAEMSLQDRVQAFLPSLQGASPAPDKGGGKNTKLRPTAVTYQHNLKEIVASWSDGTIATYGTRHGNYFIKNTLQVKFAPQCLTAARCFSTHQDLLVTGDNQGDICAYSAGGPDKNQQIANLHVHADIVRKMELLPGVGMVSCGMDGRIAVVDPERWTMMRVLSGHKRGVYTFAHYPRHRLIVSGGFDKNLMIWDPYLNFPVGYIRTPSTMRVLDVVANEARKQIITTFTNKTIKLYDVRTHKEIQELIDGFDYSPIGEWTACAYDEHTETFITASNKALRWFSQDPNDEELKVATRHGGAMCLQYSPIFMQLFSIADRGTAVCWDTQSGRSIFDFGVAHHGGVTAAFLAEGGKRLLTGGKRGKIKFWNTLDGAKAHELQAHNPDVAVNKIALVRSTLVSVGGDGGVAFTAMQDCFAKKPSHTPPVLMRTHRDTVTCLTFLDSLVVTGDEGGAFCVWNLDGDRDGDVSLLGTYAPPQPSKADWEVSAAYKEYQRKRGDIRNWDKLGERRPKGVSSVQLAVLYEGFIALFVGMSDGSLHIIDPLRPVDRLSSVAKHKARRSVIATQAMKMSPKEKFGDKGGNKEPSEELLEQQMNDLMFHQSLQNAEPLPPPRVLSSFWGVLLGGIHNLCLSSENYQWLKTRLFVTSTTDGCMFDVGGVSKDSGKMNIMRKWPLCHPPNHITHSCSIDPMKCFVTSAENGDVKVWDWSGLQVARFGQREHWPFDGVAMAGPLNKEGVAKRSQSLSVNHTFEGSDQEQEPEVLDGNLEPVDYGPSYISTHPAYNPEQLAKFSKDGAGNNLLLQFARLEKHTSMYDDPPEEEPSGGESEATAAKSRAPTRGTSRRKGRDRKQREGRKAGSGSKAALSSSPPSKTKRLSKSSSAASGVALASSTSVKLAKRKGNRMASPQSTSSLKSPAKTSAKSSLSSSKAAQRSPDPRASKAGDASSPVLLNPGVSASRRSDRSKRQAANAKVRAANK